MFKIVVFTESCLKNNMLIEAIRLLRSRGANFTLFILFTNLNNKDFELLSTISRLELKNIDYIQLPGRNRLQKPVIKDKLKTDAEILIFQPKEKQSALSPLNILRVQKKVEANDILLASFDEQNPAEKKILIDGEKIGYKVFPQRHLFINRDNRKSTEETFTYLFLKTLRAPL